MNPLTIATWIMIGLALIINGGTTIAIYLRERRFKKWVDSL